MKQVWKCDFCIDTNTNSDEMKAHERECYMNPAAKDCGTCANHKQLPYEPYLECKYGFYFEIETPRPCENWEPTK